MNVININNINPQPRVTMHAHCTRVLFPKQKHITQVVFFGYCCNPELMQLYIIQVPD